MNNEYWFCLAMVVLTIIGAIVCESISRSDRGR